MAQRQPRRIWKGHQRHGDRQQNRGGVRNPRNWKSNKKSGDKRLRCFPDAFQKTVYTKKGV